MTEKEWIINVKNRLEKEDEFFKNSIYFEVSKKVRIHLKY